MRGTNARTLATAVATLVATTSAAFLVQAAALGRPSRVQTLAVHAIAEIDRYDSSRAMIALNGTHMLADCDQQSGRDGHVEAVTLSTGAKLVEVGNTLRERGKLARDEFELASCPRALSGWLTTQLNRSAKIDLRITRAGGKPVYELRFSGETRTPRLRHPPGRPSFQLTLSGPGVQGTSELELLGPVLNQPR